MQKLIIATHNKGKLKEFQKLFENKFEVYSLPYNGYDAEVEETGTTYYENALIKAKAVYENTGELCIADDSGLSVTALNGEPGVYSARYGGENATQKQKNALIFQRLKDKTDRSAKFVCCMVYYSQDGEIITATGETKGKILEKEQGSNGFGYDPLFFSDDLQMSLGVASSEAKNTISHRFRALQALRGKLK
jgi:XTP/dITP diphosphohydrolase